MDCDRVSIRQVALRANLNYNEVIIMIGEFEYLLLTAAAKLSGAAYGAAIRQEIEETAEQRCSIGALYTTLDRLEAKGLVETWMGEATAQRGGRAKRMVRLTPQGISCAMEFYNAVMRASRGVPWELGQPDLLPFPNLAKAANRSVPFSIFLENQHKIPANGLKSRDEHQG
jgi:DNA-binding MarR family transcriptional regulator